MPNKINSEKLTKRVNLIITEGQSRGFSFEVLDYAKELVKAKKHNQGFLFKALPGVLTIIKSSRYKGWDRKDVEIKKMSEVGMKLPKTYGVISKAEELNNLDIEYPAVVKPILGTLSKNVFTNIKSKKDLITAVSIIEKTGKKILIEQYIPGNHFRILIADNTYIGCVQRKPPNVTGDGIHTIKELIDNRNKEPARGGKFELNTTVHKLVFDKTSEEILENKNLTLETVLPLGENLEIQHKILASIGSDYIDFTRDLQPKIAQKCIDFAKKFDIFIIGFDLISPDITKPLEISGGAFNEFNLKPFIDLNENNNIGEKHPASKIIWDGIESKAPGIITKDFKEY